MTDLIRLIELLDKRLDLLESLIIEKTNRCPNEDFRYIEAVSEIKEIISKVKIENSEKT